MGTTDKYCLRWNDYRSNISVAFQDLRSSADFFDVTLATEEAEIQAHRVILSACSPHLREVLKRHSGANHQNILIYLRGVRQCDLEAILEFMYNGEVNVAQEDLNSFLAVAEDLKVKGLTQNASGQSPNHSSETQSMQPHPLVKIKSSPPPPIVNRNGGGPPVKRIKRDSSVLQVKEESGSNQQVVVTPDVGYDGANSSETMKVDDPVYEVEDEGEVYPYGAYGSDSGEIGDSLIDPATMAVPGTSGMDGNKVSENWRLTSIQIETCMNERDIHYTQGGGFKCALCSRVQRDSFDNKKHFLTHLLNPQSEFSDADLIARVDEYVSFNSIKHDSKSHTCLLCNKTMATRFSTLRHHFLLSHLNTNSPNVELP